MDAHALGTAPVPAVARVDVAGAVDANGRRDDAVVRFGLFDLGAGAVQAVRLDPVLRAGKDHFAGME